MTKRDVRLVVFWRSGLCTAIHGLLSALPFEKEGDTRVAELHKLHYCVFTLDRLCTFVGIHLSFTARTLCPVLLYSACTNEGWAGGWLREQTGTDLHAVTLRSKYHGIQWTKSTCNERISIRPIKAIVSLARKKKHCKDLNLRVNVLTNQCFIR